MSYYLHKSFLHVITQTDRACIESLIMIYDVTTCNKIMFTFFFIIKIIILTYIHYLSLYLHYLNMLGVLQYVTKRLKEITKLTKLLTLQCH